MTKEIRVKKDSQKAANKSEIIKDKKRIVARKEDNKKVFKADGQNDE